MSSSWPAVWQRRGHAHRGCRLDWSREHDLWRRPRGPTSSPVPITADTHSTCRAPTAVVSRPFHRSRTAFCTLGTPSRSVSASWPTSSAARRCCLRRLNPETEDERFVEAIKKMSWWRAGTGRLCVRLFRSAPFLGGRIDRKGLPTSTTRARRRFRRTGAASPRRCRFTCVIAAWKKTSTSSLDDPCEFDEVCVRAKIDMNRENMQMRDPVMYHIATSTASTGDRWKVYPPRLGPRAVRCDQGTTRRSARSIRHHRRSTTGISSSWGGQIVLDRPGSLASTSPIRS